MSEQVPPVRITVDAVHVTRPVWRSESAGHFVSIQVNGKEVFELPMARAWAEDSTSFRDDEGTEGRVVDTVRYWLGEVAELVDRAEAIKAVTRGVHDRAW